MAGNRQERVLKDKSQYCNVPELTGVYNPHTLERFAILAIFHFIFEHKIDDTDLFFDSLPLPQDIIRCMKEMFGFDTYMYFVNCVEPNIEYHYPNEY